jgi:hypothetical protein
LRERRAFVNIGKPRRIIEVEPVSLPLPEVLPEPATEPATEPRPAEPFAPGSSKSTGR